MLKSALLLLAIVASLNVQAQQDLTFCDINTIEADPANLPHPVQNVSSRYAVSVERNRGLTSSTVEISEYYDGIANIGVAVTTELGQTSYSFNYYSTNELILVQNDLCRVFPLNMSYQLSPFGVITVDGKEHIASPLSFILNSPNVKFVYTGSKNIVRGIPVNEWVACGYDPKSSTTSRITVSYSDPRKWNPLVPVTDPKNNMPVQVKVESKSPTTQIDETFVLTNFRPNIQAPEELYITPPGVYCKERANLKPVPQVPSTFSFRAEVVEPVPNTNDFLGFVQNIREAYDLDKKLLRFEYFGKGFVQNEIHDYNTGLKYTITRSLGKCNISKIDEDSFDSDSEGVNIKLKNPNALFQLDGVKLHYVGERRVKGINTDVWIGPKNVSGQEVLFEWYFQTNFWITQESNGIGKNLPVRTIIYKKDKTNKQAKIVYNVFEFDPTRIDINDFDIGPCVGKINKKYFIMSFPNDNARDVRRYLGNVRKAITETVMSVGKLNLLRIADLDINFDRPEGIYVTFAILDKPAFYGNVEKPNDPSLDEVIKSLKSSVSGGNFKVTYNTYGVSTSTIIAKQDAFTEYTDRYSVQFSSDSGFSTVIVAVVTVVVALVGLVGGLTLMILHKSGAIKLPLVG